MTLVLIDDDAATRTVPRVARGEARREHRLRDLLHDNPAILPVHELDPSFGRVFTVARELNIPGVGFVDLLLADEHGRLVVVECKLWRNPQARREVVGQILDYARALSRYGYEDLQRQVSIATRQPGNVLYALARDAGSTLDEADFVDRVSRDLAAGRFLLIVAGDGIAEGTRRIAEYLRDQPGLAFSFGLIEIAEYRYRDGNTERVIVQPRLLAQTALIERHVIRSEIPGVVIDAVTTEPQRLARTSTGSSAEAAETSQAWSAFVARFAEEVRFDDPGQPPPRRGGNGWMRLPLPAGFYINAYRSTKENGIGVGIRFPGAEGRDAYAMLDAERAAIDAEIDAAGLPPLEWSDGEVPHIGVRHPCPPARDEQAEAEQRRWFGHVVNGLVNSLRPRLQALDRELAA